MKQACIAPLSLPPCHPIVCFPGAKKPEPLAKFAKGHLLACALAFLNVPHFHSFPQRGALPYAACKSSIAFACHHSC